MTTTWRQRLFHRGEPVEQCPECGHPTAAATCDICGYDLVRQTRGRTEPPRPA